TRFSRDWSSDVCSSDLVGALYVCSFLYSDSLINNYCCNDWDGEGQMSLDISILLIILGGAIVTFLPRVIPFMVIRNIGLPKIVIKWLSFIPICIFAALIVDSFIIQDETSLLSIDWRVLTAIIPTLIIALWTKSLSITVIVGVISMATVRFLF